VQILCRTRKREKITFLREGETKKCADAESGERVSNNGLMEKMER